MVQQLTGKMSIRNRIAALNILMIVVALCVSCEECTAPAGTDQVCDDDQQPYGLDETPRSDYEAEVIALCLSGELIAPEDLYQKVHNDLVYIRSTYGRMHRWLNSIHLIPPWVPSMICIKFNFSTGGQVESGTYHAWDSLNTALGVTEIDQFFPGNPQWWKLYFSGRKHPRRLADLYRDLPGVLVTEKTSIVYTFYNLFPKNDCFRDDVTVSYLFGRGEGDCYAGCIFGEYWYFISDGFGVRFEGHWNIYDPPGSGEDYLERPGDEELLEKAKRNKADFYKL